MDEILSYQNMYGTSGGAYLQAELLGKIYLAEKNTQRGRK